MKGKPADIDNTQWSDDYKEFVKKCLVKDHEKRPSAKDLLKEDFLKDADSPANCDEFQKFF